MTLMFLILWNLQRSTKLVQNTEIGILALRLSVWLIWILCSLFSVCWPSPPPVKTRGEQLLFHPLLCFVVLATYQQGAWWAAEGSWASPWAGLRVPCCRTWRWTPCWRTPSRRSSTPSCWPGPGNRRLARSKAAFLATSFLDGDKKDERRPTTSQGERRSFCILVVADDVFFKFDTTINIFWGRYCDIDVKKHFFCLSFCSVNKKLKITRGLNIFITKKFKTVKKMFKVR